jgi:hypothetical protein
MKSVLPGITSLKSAVEDRDAETLKSFYAPNAVLTIIDSENPPSKPRVVQGAAEIGAFLEDVYSRDMTHTLEMGVSDGKVLAFIQGCRYSDGTRVTASNIAEVGPSGIVRQTIVQAWDS